MIDFDKVDETNFLLYAAKHYDNPSCFDTLEFYEDLNRFKYIKRLFSRYEESGDLKEKLILNHIIIIYNLFGVQAATKLLFFKLKDYYSYLKPFLVMLEVCPEKVTGIGIENITINISDIPMDTKIVNVLRDIKNDRQS
jgi:hypothetical protein